MELKAEELVGAEFLWIAMGPSNSGLARYRVEKFNSSDTYLKAANLSQKEFEYSLWRIEVCSLTQIYKRAPAFDDAPAFDERGLHPEFFYQRVEIPLSDTRYLPEDHFQHPNYDATKTKLRRAPDAGSYSEIREGDHYTYQDVLRPDLGEQEGRITLVDYLNEYFCIQNATAGEFILSFGRFIPITRNWMPLSNNAPSQPITETPAIDYKTLAKNWRRFGV